MRITDVVVGGEPDGLLRLGLAVDEDGVARLGGVALRLDPDAEGLVAVHVEGAESSDVLPTVEPLDPVDDLAHPLGATAVDHVVATTGDVSTLLRGLGMTARRSVERDGRRYAFVVTETALIEIVGPIRPDATPHAWWGLALTVADLDLAIDGLGAAAGVPRPAVQPERRICTVDHERVGLSVPVALLSPRG